MLADSKIDSLDAHLQQFKLNEQSRQCDLQIVLEHFSELLIEHKALKKAFEQKQSRNISAIAPKGPANRSNSSYVLVLIDGNSYTFVDELIRDKEEGGMRAARMLHEAVDKHLQQNVPGSRDSRVIIRIYADLTHLSKQLAQSKIIGFDKRSLAPFSAGFTRGFSSSDFVDTLDEEGTRFKIREQFKAAAEDSACRHILFAACHDPAYLSLLVPYNGMQERITLVQGAGWNPDFHQFHLNVTQFPTLFRWSELSSDPHSSRTYTSELKVNGAKPKATQESTFNPLTAGWRRGDLMQHDVENPLIDLDDSYSVVTSTVGGVDGNEGSAGKQTLKGSKGSQTCKYFYKGFCRFGDKCSFKHISNSVNGNSNASSQNGAERGDISGSLPTSVSPGLVPVNKHDQRLDPYIRSPTSQEWKVYNERFHKQKPCNNFHLQNLCTTFDCPYDHNELEPEARHVLEYVLKCNPCPQRSACRDPACYYGHLCQKDGCMGHMKGCRMKADLHRVDPEVAGSATAGSATAGSVTAGSVTAGSVTAGSVTSGSATTGSAQLVEEVVELVEQEVVPEVKEEVEEELELGYRDTVGIQVSENFLW